MNTVTVTTSISRKAGGLLDAVNGLCRRLHGCCSVTVLSLRDEFSGADGKAWLPIRPILFDHWGPPPLRYSPRLAGYMREMQADIIHSHGVWMYPSLAAGMAARRRRVPLVISPHGMLDAWALRNSRWKKKLVALLGASGNLRSAACIHALCESEYRSIRGYGLKNPVCVIPNGIDLPEETRPVDTEWLNDIAGGRRIMLFLGRIHPKKGLPSLIKAWAQLNRDDKPACEEWALAIAGWPQGGHEDELKALVQELGCQSSTLFLGPLYGVRKDAALRTAQAFILPSYSEGLPMSVLEAWSYGLPVVMTAACNIPEGFRAGAAAEVRPEVASIRQGLESFFSLSEVEQRNMSLNGRRLVETQFAWPQIARQMMDVYSWCLRQGPQPSCLRLD